MPTARRTPPPAADPPPSLITPGVIAAELGVPLHRVQHVLSTRPHVRPSARAGRLRLYDREAVAMVRHALNAMDARRCRRPSAAEGGDDAR